MKLIDMKVGEYLEELRSGSPAPGGGSVSALAGAQAMALTCMVCNLTIGSPKYAESAELCREALQEAEALYREFAEAFDRDTEAFYLVADAYKLPKSTEEEKAARSAAIAAGTVEATKVPFGVMQLSLRGLELLAKLQGRTNVNAESDIKVAALGLHAAVTGAWYNVSINLPGIKDEALRRSYDENAREILTRSQSLLPTP